MAMDYAVRDFSRVRGLQKLSDGLIEAHLKLYAAYVENTTRILQRLRQNQPGTPEWSELQRRLGFEMNGMRLHEHYFEALSATAGEPSASTQEALGRDWGTFGAWREELVQMGRMRGVGWVITYYDPIRERLSNHWIELHQNGHPSGFAPIVVMDVWEHAFTGMERPAYIDAYLMSLDWGVVEQRLSHAKSVSPY
jgi:Fe-Mn family superoxide dismutase